MGHDEYTMSEIARHHRAMLRKLEWLMPAGVTRTDARLGETCGYLDGDHMLLADRVAKYRVWMHDSIAWALETAARGHGDHARCAVETMRGYAQARHYEGVLDGAGVYPHDVTSSDALGFLRNLCERTLERALVASGTAL